MTIWQPALGPEQPRYVAIADAIAADIERGALAVGDRLPTHRALADTLGVSIGTVTRAYAVAESRGLIRGETGRGTFVGRPGVDVAFDADDMNGQALDVSWPLYVHDPDLGPVLAEISRDPSKCDLLRYHANAGMMRHREAGAVWSRRFGYDPDPERVLVTAGTQHALTVVFGALTRPGDTVFAESLTYPGFKALARLFGLRVVGIPVDRHGLIPDAFESACRLRRGKALYTIPTIHNPTTATLSAERRRGIAEIAERYDITIVEDAIHHLLAPDAPPALASFAPERTCLIAGISKVVAGGLRVAFLNVPRRHVADIGQAIWATNWMAPPLGAEVAARWIHDGTAEATVARKRAEAGIRYDIATRILAGAALSGKRGGYHLWLELPSHWDSVTFANEARRRGAPVSPAETFAVNGEPVPEAVRISISAARGHAELEQSLTVLSQILSESPDTGSPVV